MDLPELKNESHEIHEHDTGAGTQSKIGTSCGVNHEIYSSQKL